MMLPSITISWISTTPAAGEDAETSFPPEAEVICANMPVAFWPATVPRTHASFTVVILWMRTL